MIIVIRGVGRHTQPDLPQVVVATDSFTGVAYGVDRCHRHARKQARDRQNHQQFYQGEGLVTGVRHGSGSLVDTKISPSWYVIFQKMPITRFGTFLCPGRTFGLESIPGITIRVMMKSRL